MLYVSDVKSTQTLLIPEGAQILLLFFIARFRMKKFLEKFDGKSTFRDFHQNRPHIGKNYAYFFWFIRVFFHKHSRIIGLRGKGEGISLTHLYHFQPLHRHLDINWAITAESSPMHIGSSRTRTGKSLTTKLRVLYYAYCKETRVLLIFHNR